MKRFSVIALFAALGMFVGSISASAQQSHFGRMKPPAFARANVEMATATAPDSTFTGWRVQGPSIVYGYSGGTSGLYTGVGYGYEHDTWKGSGWYTNWSVAPTIYAGGSVAPSSISAVAAVGVQATLLNRYLTVGGGYNFMTKNPIFVLGLSFDIFNN